MKRIAVLFLGLFVFAASSVAFANYPTYLNGNRDLILCDGHMGMGYYVDRTSLVVQKYEPPQYIIAVNVVTAVSAIGDERDFYAAAGGRSRMCARCGSSTTGICARCMWALWKVTTGALSRRPARGRKTVSPCRRARSHSTLPII